MLPWVGFGCWKDHLDQSVNQQWAAYYKLQDRPFLQRVAKLLQTKLDHWEIENCILLEDLPFLKVYTELARCERIWLVSASANHLDQDYHTSNFWCKAALSPEHTSKQNNQTKWAITQIAFNQAAAHLRANCLLPSCCRQLQRQLDRSCKSAENTKVLDTSGRLT